jgi:hypothetical protein
MMVVTEFGRDFAVIVSRLVFIRLGDLGGGNRKCRSPLDSFVLHARVAIVQDELQDIVGELLLDVLIGVSVVRRLLARRRGKVDSPDIVTEVIQRLLPEGGSVYAVGG